MARYLLDSLVDSLVGRHIRKILFRLTVSFLFSLHFLILRLLRECCFERLGKTLIAWLEDTTAAALFVFVFLILHIMKFKLHLLSLALW